MKTWVALVLGYFVGGFCGAALGQGVGVEVGPQGEFLRVSNPLSRVILKSEELKGVRQMLVSPDGKTMAITTYVEKGGKEITRLELVDVSTGRPRKILADFPGLVRTPLLDCILPRENSVAGTLATFKLDNGDPGRRFEVAQDKRFRNASYSRDGARVAATGEKGEVLVWDVSTRKGTEFPLGFKSDPSLTFVFPLANREELLAAVGDDGGGAALYLLGRGTKSRKLGHLEGNFNILPAADGKRAFVLRQDKRDEGLWSSIETWDLDAAKVSGTQALKPPMSAISFQLAADDHVLFIHEYLVQSVFMWDLAHGTMLGAIGPPRGGCRAFAATQDGSRVIAITGDWQEGTLVPTALCTYDTSDLAAKATKP